jgi:hypothetical protein
MGVNLSVVTSRLGAEGAVLGAVARLGTYDRPEEHPVAPVFERDLPCKGNEVRNLFVRQLGEREGFVKRDWNILYKKLFCNL